MIDLGFFRGRSFVKMSSIPFETSLFVLKSNTRDALIDITDSNQSLKIANSRTEISNLDNDSD